MSILPFKITYLVQKHVIRLSDMEAISGLSVSRSPVQTKLLRFNAFCSRHNDSHSPPRVCQFIGRHKYKRYGSFKKIDNQVILDESTLTALMLSYANNGFFTQAEKLWHELINSCYNLDIRVVSDLINAYIDARLFDEVIRIVHQTSLRHPRLQHKVYAHTVSCFGKIGELELMDNTLKEMVSNGLPVDSATGNAYIIYYSRFGSIPMMENAYKRLKSRRFLIEKDGIRAVSDAYIRDKKFHDLGSFLRNVGLGRRNVGNLLWNLLLLSYAANFKMKSLQREFLNMVEAGFYPDLTTFNIRAAAFSKMSLFWDLHLSVEHMNQNGILPDLVTYGCIVDAYLDRRLGRNLDFVLRRMNVEGSAVVLTDPIVFEVLGKGDFQSSAEAVFEFKKDKTWSYKELIAIYLKKRYRSNQVFWNY